MNKRFYDYFNHFSELPFFSRGEENFSYSFIKSAIDNKEKVLQKEGIKENDLVGIKIKDPINFFSTLFALWKLKATAVPFFDKMPEESILSWSKDFQLNFFIEDHKIPENSIITPKTCKKLYKQKSKNTQGPGVVILTSGSSGRPKGVFRKENPPPSKTEQLTLDTAAFDPDSDFSICPGPAYHAAPLGLNINISLMAGVGVYLMDKWDAEKMLSLIDQYKCTHTHMVATMFHRILRLPEETKSRYDLSSMRWILHGAAPCPVEVKQGMMDWMGPILYEYYAATEGGGCFIQPKEWLDKPGSVGRANEGTEVKILDDNFKEVEIGEEGTIYFSAPSKGRFEYYKAEEKTSGAYWGDYFTMGDIGFCDKDGYHFLTGRSADTIISGGTNIYPQEIDNVLLMHEKVAEVCCVGVPNKEWGEEIKAVINLEAGADQDEVLKELVAMSEERLSGFKKPKSYEFWKEELPRLPTGKIQRNLVKKRFW